MSPEQGIKCGLVAIAQAAKEVEIIHVSEANTTERLSTSNSVTALAGWPADRLAYRHDRRPKPLATVAVDCARAAFVTETRPACRSAGPDWKPVDRRDGWQSLTR